MFTCCPDFLKFYSLLFSTQITRSLELLQEGQKKIPNPFSLFSGHTQPPPATQKSPTARRPTAQQMLDGALALNDRIQVYLMSCN